MNGRKLYSASEAAERLGVARRTIQRHLRKGTISWHGKVRHGSRAVGIDLKEAQTVLRQHVTERPAAGAAASALARLFENPTDALRGFFKAIRNEADVDFICYCIDRMRSEDEVFIAAAFGIDRRPCPAGARVNTVVRAQGAKAALAAKKLMDPLRWEAVGKLQALLAAQEDEALVGRADEVLAGKPFNELLRALAKRIRVARVDVAPGIVYDHRIDRAYIALLPNWLIHLPEGLLPLWARESVISVTSFGGSDVASKAALTIARRIHAAPGSERPEELAQYRLYASHADRDTEYLRLIEKTPWESDDLNDAEDDQEQLLERPSGEMPAGDPEMLLRSLQEHFGLQQAESRAFLRVMRRLSGDVAETDVQTLTDQPRRRASERGDGAALTVEDESDTEDHGGPEVTKGNDWDTLVPRYTVSAATLAEVFHVSRQTMQKWLLG